MESSTKYIIGAAGVAVVGLGVVGGVLLTKNNTSSTNKNTADTSATTQGSTTTGSSKSYKDGAYTADGTYMTPEGEEKITVTLTLKGNAITEVNTTSNPVHHESRQYQTFFQNNYKKLVVGKKIDEVNLSRVSGSSLTPIGFNAALNAIKQQAAS